MKPASSFALRAPQRGAALLRRPSVLGHRPKTLAQVGFTPAEQVKYKKGSPQKLRFCGVGKKKMRSLGSVQLPTEAFMAVLKLDEE